MKVLTLGKFMTLQPCNLSLGCPHYAKRRPNGLLRVGRNVQIPLLALLRGNFIIYFCMAWCKVPVILVKNTSESSNRALHKAIFAWQRSIFQTFWRLHSCAKFLFFELETSNFGYLLICWFCWTVQSLRKIGQHLY